jgi:tetratricopeptide (TPR) repeat protein
MLCCYREFSLWRKTFFCCETLFLLLVLGCSRLNGQPDNGSISGQITISRGSFPPERIKLTLQTRGIVVSEVWTDTEGKFLFRDLPGNLYHVSIDDDKYERYETGVKVEPRITPINIISITLRPKMEARSAPDAAIHGANPYLVDPAELERNFPKDAVREFKRGTEAQLKGDYETAVLHFIKALKLAPNLYPAHNDLGAVFVSQSRFTEAQTEFETVLKLNQSDTEAYFNLGNVFLLTKRYEEASRMIEEGLRRQPNSAYGQFLMGSVYERQGRMPESERALREAIRLDPGLARAHLQLVNLYLREQRSGDAITELRVFLKNFPSDPLAPHATEVLQKLTSQQGTTQ